MPITDIQESQKTADASEISEKSEVAEEAQSVEGTEESEEASGEAEVEEKAQEEQFYLLDKYKTKEAAEKGVKELERSFHERAQEAAELKRKLEAVQAQVQTAPTKPQLTPEQELEKYWQNPVQYTREVMQQEAKKMVEPLMQFAAETHIKELEREMPGFGERRSAIEQKMEDLNAGKIDLAKAAYWIDRGQQAQELQLEAEKSGVKKAYEAQQRKIAAQPPSGKAQPNGGNTSLTKEQRMIADELGVTPEKFAESLEEIEARRGA